MHDYNIIHGFTSVDQVDAPLVASPPVGCVAAADSLSLFVPLAIAADGTTYGRANIGDWIIQVTPDVFEVMINADFILKYEH